MTASSTVLRSGYWGRHVLCNCGGKGVQVCGYSDKSQFNIRDILHPPAKSIPFPLRFGVKIAVRLQFFRKLLQHAPCVALNHAQSLEPRTTQASVVMLDRLLDIFENNMEVFEIVGDTSELRARILAVAIQVPCEHGDRKDIASPHTEIHFGVACSDVFAKT